MKRTTSLTVKGREVASANDVVHDFMIIMFGNDFLIDPNLRQEMLDIVGLYGKDIEELS